MRTRTNYYNFCRFNIFNIHCDTFFSGRIFYATQAAGKFWEAFLLKILVQQESVTDSTARNGREILSSRS